MNKIFEFLKQPYTTTILSVLGLGSGLLAGMFIVQVLNLNDEQLDKRKACAEAFSVMCVQVHMCTGSPVSVCDEIVKEKEVCNVNLPEMQVLVNCKEELRHIECDSDLPATCAMFME